jgi:uncharacterized membrane protein (DUF373 family)
MEDTPHAPGKFFAETREHWPIMSFYERFEQIVATVLSLVISVVIALALLQLIIRIVPLLLSGAIDPLEHDVFQALFGMIMTLLIAMEFKHSIVRVALRQSSIIQVKTVVLIALIALSRKFVILDSIATSASTIAALAGATLVLGVVYWLLRERDDRLVKEAH